jgi:hypothetical protein
MITIEIAITNGRSLKLRQTCQADVFSHPLQVPTKNEGYQPISGLQGGLGVGGEGRGVGREGKEKHGHDGCQVIR